MFDDLEVQLDSSPTGTTLVVSGEIDRVTCGQLRARIAEAAGRRDALAIDVNAVSYLDSAAIAALFDAVRVHGATVVAGSGCLVRPALEIAGLPLTLT